MQHKSYQDGNRHHYYRPLLGISLCISSFVMAMLSTTAASAGFNQLGCPTTGFGSPIPTSIGGNEFVRRSFAPPVGGPQDMFYYNNNTRSKSWRFYTNGNVVELSPWYGYFDTEPTYDYFRVRENGLSNYYTYTGTLNISTSPVQAGNTWRTNAAFWGAYGRVDMGFYSDSSVTISAPPVFSQVSPKCRQSSTNAASNGTAIETNSRVDGLLLGTGDTIYFTVPLLSSQVVVAMESLSASAGADFDLYGSLSNPTPDDSSFDYRGYRSGTDEAIQVVNHSGSNLYIGVHSYNGSGALHPASLSRERIIRDGLQRKLRTECH